MFKIFLKVFRVSTNNEIESEIKKERRDKNDGLIFND